ncbi:MAG: hypothetical protein K8R02_08565 [Anaerohalosphaeraceae bacterium]|nr:hypothetical protein [Anaerohalosphaeraceae bacterium]
MSKDNIARHIYIELKEHVPFTLVGAVLGVAFMLLFRGLSKSASHSLFAVFHPAHVVLSAMATAAMFKIHRVKTTFFTVLIVGYIGSIGIATLSDSVIPFFGGKLLGLDIPTHHHAHEASEHSDTIACAEPHKQPKGIHLGFIEEWYIVNPAAIFGVIIAWFYPRTKSSHAGHVLISTWASSAYILMTAQNQITFVAAMAMVLVLFISIWLPCCLSDIIFPLLLAGRPHSCKKCETKE